MVAYFQYTTIFSIVKQILLDIVMIGAYIEGMGKTAAKGNRKMPKGDQPKRKRYNVSRRGYLRRLRDLESHVQWHVNDEQSKSALRRLKPILAGIKE